MTDSLASTDLTAAWSAWIADMGEWHVFGALTYDPKRPHGMNMIRDHIPRSEVAAKRDVRHWLRQAQKELHRPIEAGVIALEYQKNGWPHFHPLLRIAGGLQGNEFRILGRTWFFKNGYAKLEVPRSQDDVSAYAAKYLVKDLARGDVVFWPPHGSLSQHQPALEA